ncbi:MAG: NAD+ synthase [Planctomycetota bacterium]
MRIALAQLDYTIGDFDGNLARMRAAWERAGREGADLCLFSECAIPGYPARDLLEHAAFVARNLAALDELAAWTADGPAILVGFVEPREGDGNPLANAAALCDGGRRVGVARKSLLPTYDVFDEDRYFEPADAVAPLAWRGRRLGVTICEDVWNDRGFWPRRRYELDPVERLVEQGAELILNLSASPFHLGKIGLRRAMMAASAARYGVPLVCVNQVGANDELVFDGTSFVVTRDGGLGLELASFREDFAVWDEDAPEAGRPVPAAAPLTLAERAVEAHDAVVLGLRDYVHKCGFADVLLGLSGGIDSALVAALAVEALGPDHVAGFALPSRYSSPHSRADAEALARNLGIAFEEVPIEPCFEASLATLAPLFAGLPEDVTEENLQARIRGLLLMAVSNKRGALLLSTGNKSELAVGYCTLYGDMNGGLAVISDVPKTLVYAIARHVNREREVIPVSTMTKPPSAELRPGQVDVDSLPPYEVLDRILELHVEQHAPLDAIVAEGFEPALVERIVRMIERSEYSAARRRRGSRSRARPSGSADATPWPRGTEPPREARREHERGRCAARRRRRRAVGQLRRALDAQGRGPAQRPGRAPGQARGRVHLARPRR